MTISGKLCAWLAWSGVSGAVMLLAFSTFEPVAGVLALSAVGVLALHALRRSLSAGVCLGSGWVPFVAPGLSMFLILGANAAEADVPENATGRSYGSGWSCDPGYRKSGEDCLLVVIPEDAYATGDSFGRGWDCRHGFRRDNDNERCLPVHLPTNAYLDASGTGWKCSRGFREVDDACEAISVPEHGYLTESTSSQQGWECERGYMPLEESCKRIEVPENAFLSQSSRYGPGWECERGFVRSGDGCEFLMVPANAHLRYDGAGWECDKPFRKRNGACVER